MNPSACHKPFKSPILNHHEKHGPVSRPTTSFKPPFLKSDAPDAQYKRPAQPALSLSKPPQSSSLSRASVRPAEDPAARKRRENAIYGALFDELESSLSLEKAEDQVVLKKLSDLYDKTAKIYEDSQKSSSNDDDEHAMMDAYGTQLWNISVSLKQNIWDKLSKEQKKYIAIIRRVAILQLELGLPKPIDCHAASRIVNTASQTAVIWLDLDVPEAEIMLQRCSKYLEPMYDTYSEVSKTNAAEAFASLHCAKYALAKKNFALPDYELEKAVQFCKTISPSSWPYQQTILNCLQYGKELYQKALTLSKEAQDRSRPLESAAIALKGAVDLLSGCHNTDPSRQKASELLVKCYGELAQVTGSMDHYNSAEQVLLDQEVFLKGDENKHAALAQSLLLRLEILEERKASVEDWMTVWDEYANLRDVKAADVDRIICLILARESRRNLSNGEGGCLIDVAQCIVDAILCKREPDIQKMVGKLLLTVFKAVCNLDDVEKARKLLDKIPLTGFVLNPVIAHSCQTLLCELGGQHKQACLYALAGHEAFHSQRTNAIKALRKSAWQLIEDGKYAEAQDALRSVPLVPEENSLTFLASCVVHIRLKNESSALKSLKSLVSCRDFKSEMLPLIIKEAQDAKLRPLRTEALVQLLNAVTSGKTEAASRHRLPEVARTVLVLLLEEAEQEGGFTMESGTRYVEVLTSIMDNVIDPFARQHPTDDKCADVTTWIFKTAYNVANDERHVIEPKLRNRVSDCAVKLFLCRKDFDKELDDESYHICLYAQLHRLTATVALAKGVSSDKKEEYYRAWKEVQCMAQECLNAFKDASAHNQGGLLSLAGAETAIYVLMGEAMVFLQSWQEVQDLLAHSGPPLPADAIEGIANRACDESDCPQDTRLCLLECTIRTLYRADLASSNNVPRYAAWFQRTMQTIIDGAQSDVGLMMVNVLAALLQDLKDDKVLEQWPKDMLDWTSDMGWKLGTQLYEEGNYKTGQNLLALSVEVARRGGNSKRVDDMEGWLNKFKRQRDASGIPGFEPRE